MRRRGSPYRNIISLFFLFLVFLLSIYVPRVYSKGASLASQGEQPHTAALSSATDLRDIKPLEHFRGPWFSSYAFWALILFIVLILALYIYFSRKRKGGDSLLTVPEPPHVTALNAFRTLRDQSLLEKGMHKEFHFSLSEIFRAYLEGRYGFHATDLTTEEIMEHIRKSALLEKRSMAEAREFLHVTDLVKFSNHNPGNDVSRRLLEKGESFVTSTMELEELSEGEG